MLLRRYHKRKVGKVEGKKDVLVEWDSFTVAELKDVAKAEGIKGYSNMTKSELVEVLEGD